MSKMAPPVNAPSRAWRRAWRRAGGLHSSKAAPPSLYGIAPIPYLCYGPRYAAIWHANAHQLTTSRGPRDEALRDSGAPTVGSGWNKRSGVRNSDLKAKNSKLTQGRLR